MIVLQDVAFTDLHALVEFIYHGEVNVHQRSLSSFLKTAEVLRVSGLTQQQAEDTNNVSEDRTIIFLHRDPVWRQLNLISNPPLSTVGTRTKFSQFRWTAPVESSPSRVPREIDGRVAVVSTRCVSAAARKQHAQPTRWVRRWVWWNKLHLPF